jgi:hypothetical protein
MKKTLLCLALAVSGSALAATDHYILRDGNHVQHLKITQLKGEYKVTADVDFEPNADEKDKIACSSEVIGEAKSTGTNKLQLKKHSEGGANYCVLDIELTTNGAKIEQSKACESFVTGICHFSTGGKEIPKIK